MTGPSEITEWTWNNKYRFKQADGTPIDSTIEMTFARVAAAVAAAEKAGEQVAWAQRFLDVLQTMEFLPAGRIIAGAGTGRQVTLFNCFVMGKIPDSLDAIFEHLKEAALTMKEGGGIGHDFSTLRPRGALVKSVGSDSSGPVSFMDVWDAMCKTIMSAGARRGAMMATMCCDHPDIEEFIDAKKDAARLRNFNVSVVCTDAFMHAVENDGPWTLVFNEVTYKTIRARDLWEKIMRNTYDFADPGVIFIDRVNEMNPLGYAEKIDCCNPCGEQFLPPYGACLLGSINLTKFIIDPFTEGARIAYKRLGEVTAVAVRFLDNVVDVSHYPLPQQREEAIAKRRIGLGITGLADALVMLGCKYGSEAGRRAAGLMMQCVAGQADLTSEELGAEKGDFPLFDAAKFSARWSRPVNHRRNSHLTSIAPTGTISLLAGNISSGIEPIFDYVSQRKLLLPDNSRQEVTVKDYAIDLFEKRFSLAASLPEHWQRAADLTPDDHLEMVAALQPYVDSAISKTINLPVDIPFDGFRHVYKRAFSLGLKGCTTYRPNETTGSILSSATMQVAKPAADPLVSAGVPAGASLNVVQLGTSKPLDRPAALDGTTYKLKPPGAEHAMYLTITDIEVNGQLRPFELFINTKNLEHSTYVVALSRMISAIFRKGGDIRFIVEELKAVHDARGGFYMGEKYVPSIIAAIGDVIDQHLIRRHLIEGPTVLVESRHCPKCQTGALRKSEGCWVCGSCDYSKC